MRKKDLLEEIIKLKSTVRELTAEAQVNELRHEHVAKGVRELRGILIEAGILEPDWEPEAPKGSSIKPNNAHYGAPTYTKINKVWE